VSFHDFRADEEAETGAGDGAHAVGRAVTTFEDTTSVCLRYADSLIANRDRRCAGDEAYVDVDLSTIR